MRKDNAIVFGTLVILCLVLVGVSLVYSDYLWLTVALSAMVCTVSVVAINVNEKRQQLYADRPSPPPFETPVDDIIKRLNIDMMVFENVDREFFYVENLRHLTMADLDKIDLRRSVKCRLLECLHALVFQYPISAQLTQPDVFSV